MKSVVSTDRAPAAIGPYSQAILSGNVLYISGQIPVNPADGTVAKTVEEQATQVLVNLEEVLSAAGMGKDNVVKVNIYMKDLSAFVSVNGIYGKFFEGTAFPARVCVEVSRLPKDVLIEMDAVAVK